MTRIHLKLRMSDQPILYVNSAPMQHLIDYIVYMCSGLSFWLGFCPLTIAGWMERRVRKGSTMGTISPTTFANWIERRVIAKLQRSPSTVVVDDTTGNKVLETSASASTRLNSLKKILRKCNSSKVRNMSL